MSRSFCVFLLTLLISCSPRSEETGHTFRIYKENGVTITETTGGPKYEGELFRYEKVLILQQDTTRQESLLFRPERFLMGENGYFYIADVGNMRVAVFDQNGHYSHQIGREGRGPGEFQYPRILCINDGILAVNDMDIQRTTTFHINGQLEKIYTTLLIASGSPTVFPTVDNTYVTAIIRWDRRPNAYQSQWYDLIGFSSQGDTLYSIQTQKAITGYSYPTGIEGRQGLTYISFGGRPSVVYVPGKEIISTTGTEPAFTCYGLDGQVNRIIRASIEGDPVSEEERLAILETFQRRKEMARTSEFKNRVQNQIDALQIPDTKGYWAEVHVDEFGYIWAGEPILMYLLPEAGRVYRVFSPEGEYLGNTLWPNFLWSTPSNGNLLTIERDSETGETIPTVYRIIPAVEGLKYP